MATGENRRSGATDKVFPLPLQAGDCHFHLGLASPPGLIKGATGIMSMVSPTLSLHAKPPPCKGEEASLGEEWAGLGSAEVQQLWQWPRVITMMKVVIKNHNNKPFSNSQRAFSLSPGVWNLAGLV